MNRTSQLIQCQVGESGSSLTTRFVEQELFELWRHRLEAMHHLTIRDPQPCVWMRIADAHDWPEHFGDRANVVRASFEKANEDSGATLRQTRYFEQRHYNRLKLLVGGQIFEDVSGTPDVSLEMGVVIKH